MQMTMTTKGRPSPANVKNPISTRSISRSHLTAAFATAPRSNNRKDKGWYDVEDEWDDGVIAYCAAAFLAGVLTFTCPSGGGATTTSTTTTVQFWLLIASYVWTMVCYARVQGTDPGYLSAEIMLASANSTSSASSAPFTVDTIGTPPPATTATMKTTATTATTTTTTTTTYTSTFRKPCTACKLAPPLRAHHCKTCRRCVATFDHHCDFIGTCIGERNRGRFWWLLLAQCTGFVQSCRFVRLLSLSLQTTSSFLALWNDCCNWQVIRVCLAKLYLYPLTAAAVVMLIVHSVWAVCNATTFEWSQWRHLEYLVGFVPRELPFSQGVRRNLRVYFSGRSSSSRTNNSTRWKPIAWQLPNKKQPRLRMN